RLELAELEEQVLGVADARGRAGQHRDRVLEIQRRVGRAAVLARVAVLVGLAADRAGAADVAVRQEHAALLVVGLLDDLGRDVARRLEAPIEGLGQLAVLLRVRGQVVVHADPEGREIALVLGGDGLDELLGAHARALGAQHRRGAVRVARADVDAVLAAQALEARPDVGLDVLDHVADVQRVAGVGQRAGDENLALRAQVLPLRWVPFRDPERIAGRGIMPPHANRRLPHAAAATPRPPRAAAAQPQPPLGAGHDATRRGEGHAPRWRTGDLAPARAGLSAAGSGCAQRRLTPGSAGRRG